MQCEQSVAEEQIKAYTATVCAQVRWKRAHKCIETELGHHIIDQRDAYITEGSDEAEATQKAVAQMGDPMGVGVQFDRTHRPKPQWKILILTAILLITGFIVRGILFDFSADMLGIVPILIGTAGMFILYFLDYTIIARFPKTAYGLIILISLIILSISTTINGRRMDGFYVTLVLPIAFVPIVYIMRGRGALGVLISGLSAIPLLIYALLVPALLGALSIATIVLIVAIIAVHSDWYGGSRKWSYIIIACGVALALLIVLSQRNVTGWIATIFGRASDSYGENWLITQVRNILANSQFIGTGSVTDIDMRLPDKHYSYILTYLIHSKGWLAFIIVVAVIVAFIVYGFVRSLRVSSGSGRFISLTIMLIFASQTFGYLVTNLGLIRVSSYSLPLISHGGIYMLIDLSLIGLLMSVFRSGMIEPISTRAPLLAIKRLIPWLRKKADMLEKL